jgi:hypothetical protein
VSGGADRTDVEILERTTAGRHAGRASSRWPGRSGPAGRIERTGHSPIHVLDAMAATLEATETGRVEEVASRTLRPDPLPADWDPDAADARAVTPT